MTPRQRVRTSAPVEADTLLAIPFAFSPSSFPDPNMLHSVKVNASEMLFGQNDHSFSLIFFVPIAGPNAARRIGDHR
jgi:hypothetical protein